MASVTAQPLSLAGSRGGASEPEWHRLEREASRHFDGFTWLCDPPTDEGFKIPQTGDTAEADPRR